jgi:hypothetical protein
MRLFQKDFIFTQSSGDGSANVLIYNINFLCAFAPLRETIFVASPRRCVK